jgi:branched-chain amino acid transport system permease protein
MLQYLVSGVAVGAAYGLVALGFVITYQGAKFFNFAHGEFFMLGALLTFWFVVFLGVPTFVAIALGAAVVTAVGMVAERLVFRRFVLAGVPAINLIIASLGLSSVIRGVSMATWGPEPHSVPRVVGGEPVVNLGPAVLQTDLAVLVLVTVGLSGMVFGLYRYTRMGVAIRATADRIRVVGIFGIELRHVLPMVLAISALLGAVAGGMVAPTFKAQVAMGVPILVKAFAAAILGGLNNIWGALLGGVALGVAESFTSQYVGANWSEVLTFSVVLVMLAVRPQGLLGKREIVKV